MEPANQVVQVSKGKLWAGRVISDLIILFMLFNVVIHFLHPSVVVDSFKMLGYNPQFGPTLAIILFVPVLFYIMPRTSVLGAILITGYLGGAVATNLRVEAPLFSSILFPVYIGVFLWLGLWLRDEKLSALIPIKK